ncbi:MAG: hypothetical protein P8M19_03670 [Crocinitomicaceae bacterium]|nr:hypothetical protein [Crocinitomicaceae bacterium]MDG1659011.1 hypothetical protein [Crocinitomicaceae bacterium]MDG2440747.1 hypothetical protein [Crocinitomicaceae bacterium]
MAFPKNHYLCSTMLINKLLFETDDAKLGLTQARGFAWFTKKGVMFEYQVTDTVFEMMKSELTELFVPFEQVKEIRWEKSWFTGGIVYISLNSLKDLDQVPFLDETELCLELDRKQKTEGKEFGVNAALQLAYFRIEELDKL